MACRERIWVVAALAAWTYGNLALGQSRSGNAMAFLGEPPATRLVATGGMHAASGVPTAAMLFHNPGMIADSLNGGIDLNISPITEGMKYASVAYVHTVDGVGNLAFGVQYAGYGTFSQTDEEGHDLGTFRASDAAFYLTYNRRLAPGLHVGATLKPIVSRIADRGAFGLAMDMGATLVRHEGRLVAGLALRNAGVVAKRYSETDDRDALDFDILASISYKAEHAPFRLQATLKDITQWDLSNSGSKLNFGDNLMRHLLLGFEFTPVPAFYFGFGYDQRKRREMTGEGAGGAAGFSWGAGLKVRNIAIQYAHSRYHIAGSLNSITLSTNWRKLMGR